MYVAIAALPAQTAAATDNRPLLRFPDIHDDTIVFVHGEDIWSVPAAGGVATRLTIHDGEERFPKFSPDGEWIAFTGEYDGNGDVYIMSRHGGEITRVTWHPNYDEVVGWHPTSNKILFRSGRSSFNRFHRLFLVNPDGTGIEELILHEAAQGSFSPDGGKIAYNRVSRETRTWKRYVGGNQQDIRVFDFATSREEQITDFGGTDRIPMWIGDKIYFVSDRDYTLNIYSYDTASKQTDKITNHDHYDVRRASMGGDKIVYELGGALYLLDTATGQTAEVPVEVLADAAEARPYIKDVSHNLQGFDISPSGKRAVVVARGEVFTVPAEHGPTRNLTRNSGTRDKDATWSPDGKYVAYVSDAAGEYDIYIVDPRGGAEPDKLTSHTAGYLHTLRWSPNSDKIAYTDHTLTLNIVDIKSKKITRVDKAEYEHIDVSLDLKPIYDFRWSPDGRYIAYSKLTADWLYQVYVYEVHKQKVHCVSDGLFNDFHPAWAASGEHLFFVSNRRFSPTLCDVEWEMVYKDLAGIYCLTLAADGDPLLGPRSDEEEVDGKEDDEDNNKEDDRPDLGVDIDFDGLATRIEMLPLPRSNYRYLAANDDGLFYLDKDQGDFNRFEYRSIGSMDLHRFCYEERESETVIEGIRGYRMSADGEKIAYRKRGDIGIVKASATDSDGESLDLSDLRMQYDPRAEWKQIFDEAWRIERDFYYEPDMHGLDWDKMREKYGSLIPYASCRQDVRFLVGELIGELNTSHTYVFGGDIQREAEYVNVGMLGVDWEIDQNRYRFRTIYRVPDWTRDIQPPLARPGVVVNEGDYLLAVNGAAVTAERNIYSYFQDLAGEQVTIRVSEKADGKNAREYTVEPIRGEYTLRYLNWVENNRRICEAESEGQIGYIHLPDTYMGSAREFPKYYYSQITKKGLVIDGRFNGGGLDPYIFLHRLKDKPVAYWTRRYSGDQINPVTASRAHMVCLTNRQAGSGGDMLPMEFQMLEMGPVIGTRTWGGLVGVSMWIPLVDGGGMSAPDYRIYTPQGNWIVENEGVTPDIIVDLDPEEVSRGFDAQLMRGIDELKRAIEADPLALPDHPAFPKQKK
jgi:tricorn protease